MTKGTEDSRISIRSVRKDPPDYKKLGRALLMLAAAKAEAEAQAQNEFAKTVAKDSCPPEAMEPDHE